MRSGRDWIQPLWLLKKLAVYVPNEKLHDVELARDESSFESTVSCELFVVYSICRDVADYPSMHYDINAHFLLLHSMKAASQ